MRCPWQSQFNSPVLRATSRTVGRVSKSQSQALTRHFQAFFLVRKMLFVDGKLLSFADTCSLSTDKSLMQTSTRFLAAPILNPTGKNIRVLQGESAQFYSPTEPGSKPFIVGTSKVSAYSKTCGPSTPSKSTAIME